MSHTPRKLDWTTKQETSYAIPLWLRNQQIKHALKRVKGRIQPHDERPGERVAVVGFGPSLQDTWEQIRDFKYIITCSGSHKFLIDRGIIPTWHCLPPHSVIQTEDGPKSIKEITDTKYAGRVRSFVNGSFEWRKVTHWMSRPNSTGKQWVRLKLQGKRPNLQCTSDHRLAVFRDPLYPTQVEYLPASDSVGTFSVGVVRDGICNASYNPEQMSILIGTLLGDATIHKDGSYLVSHCDAQEDYIRHTHAILGGRLTAVVYPSFNKRHPFYLLRAKSNAQTTHLRRLLYANGKKSPINVLPYIDAIALAFWYMDDGNLMTDANRSPRIRLFTIGFSDADQEALISHLADKFDIRAVMQKDVYPNGNPKHYLRLGVTDSEKFFEIIAPYIHPSMEYKLPEKYRGGAKHTFDTKPLDFSLSLIESMEKPSLSRSRAYLYDIEVEGSHNFVADGAVVHNCEVDPRNHKIKLLGDPHPDVIYFPSSTSHPDYLEHLAKGLGPETFDAHVLLWHVFDNSDDGERLLPRGEWCITGGCDVGLRAMGIAAFLGFRDLHIFGLDGSAREKRHADDHPHSGTTFDICEYDGVEYRTTPGMLEAARQIGHELDQMPAVKTTFYGEGLIQHMYRNYERKPPKSHPSLSNVVGVSKPELISTEYRDLNNRLHSDNLAYGVGGAKHAETVLKIAKAIGTTSILDYGCGKGLLAESIPFPIWEYDPAIPGKEMLPRPADLVVCTDVLEHIEPDKILYVLDDLRRCVLKVGYFVIHTGPAIKTYANGENTHLLQRDRAWWKAKLKKFFTIGKITEKGPELYVVVGPKVKTTKVKKPEAELVAV